MTLISTARTVGELRRSDDVVDDAAACLARLAEDGYLFLPGFHDRDEVLDARADVIRLLERDGVVRTEGGRVVQGPGPERGIYDDLAKESTALQALLYSGSRIAWFERLFGESVRHFDFTWLRAVVRGRGTPPHMDSVFMNRGTPRLLTCWTPLGDVDRRLGGVTVLAGSHRVDDVTAVFGARDVDSFCENTPEQEHNAWDGMLPDEAVELCERSGLQWLSTDYLAGDLLAFPMFTTHAGLANQTDDVRLSCDTRYQRASEQIGRAHV